MFKHFKNQHNISPIKSDIKYRCTKNTKSFIGRGRSFISGFKGPISLSSGMKIFNSFKISSGLLCNSDMLRGRYFKLFKLRLKNLMPFSVRGSNLINSRFIKAFRRLLKLYKRGTFRRYSRYYKYKNALNKRRVVFFLFLNKFRKNSSSKYSISGRQSIFKRLLSVRGFVTSNKCIMGTTSGKFKFKIAKRGSARMKFSSKRSSVCKPVKFVYGKYSTFYKLISSCTRIRFFLRKYRKVMKKLSRGMGVVKFKNRKNVNILEKDFGMSIGMEKAGILLRKHTKNPYITPRNRVPYLRSCSKLFKRLFTLHLFFRKLSCVNHSVLNVSNLISGNYHNIFMGSLRTPRVINPSNCSKSTEIFSNKPNSVRSLYSDKMVRSFSNIYKLSIESSCSIVNSTNLLNGKVMSSLDDFKNLFIVKKEKRIGDRMVFGGLKGVYRNTSEVFGFFISKYSRFLLKKRRRKGHSRKRFRRRNFFFRDKFRKRFKKSLIGLIFFKNKNYINDLLEYFFY